MAQMASVIGSVMPYVSTVANMAGTLDTIINDPQKQRQKENKDRQGLALKQLQNKQAINLKQSTQATNLDKEQIRLDKKIQEESRKKALKRAVARQKVKFGSRGISSNSGSGEAVLLGLFEESEDEKKKRDSLDNIRSKALDQKLGNKKSLNLLQATQLKQRQDLENLYSDF